MGTVISDRKNRRLLQNEALGQGEIGGVWQVESGVLRIDSAQPDGVLEFSHLALPGDYVGVENLVGVQGVFMVRAITPARLAPVVVEEEEQRIQLLTDAFIQRHRGSREVLNLRAGDSTVRISRLLQLLALSEQLDLSGRLACTLPSLKDMAFIVSLTPESVCRVLSSMRQTEQLQPRVSRPRTRRSTRRRASAVHAESGHAAISG